MRLNKLEGKKYQIEEEITTKDGIFEGYLGHGNVRKDSISIWTGKRMTGDKVENFFLSYTEEKPWKFWIKIFSKTDKVYLNYESEGDTVDADDINFLQDSKVDKIEGKGLSTEDYTTTEKEKLEKIEEGANQYLHPQSHLASMITQDSTHRFVTDEEKNKWNLNDRTAGEVKSVNGKIGEVELKAEDILMANGTTVEKQLEENSTQIKNTKGTISSAIDTGKISTEHKTQVNASGNSTASGGYSQVNCSDNSTASIAYSQVNASIGSTASGTRSQINASMDSTASGQLSQVNASFNSTASNQYSQVNCSDNSTASGRKNQVNASYNVINNQEYTVAGGYGTAEPSTENIKWRLNSKEGTVWAKENIMTDKYKLSDLDKKINKAGDTFTGIAKAYPNTSYTVGQLRNVIISPNDANTDVMNDGEIWIKYK